MNCFKGHKRDESKNLHMLNAGNHHMQTFMFWKLGTGMSKHMANIRNIPFSGLSLEKELQSRNISGRPEVT
jgi:hypothetical protein